MKLSLFVVWIILAGLTISACSQGDDGSGSDVNDPSATSTPSITTSPSPSAPIATAVAVDQPDETDNPTTFQVGDSAPNDSGGTVTVYSLELPATPDAFWESTSADPGHVFGTIDVEVCIGLSGGGDENPRVSPLDFELQLTDNTRFKRKGGHRLPQFRDTDMALGDCLRGFVTFEVPEGSDPKQIVYDTIGDGDNIKWTID